MTSAGRGRGQLFWQEQGVTPKYFRDRSTNFDIQHDDQSHDYVVPFTSANAVQSIRLDPGQGPGRVRVREMSLVDDDGNVHFKWAFRRSANDD